MPGSGCQGYSQPGDGKCKALPHPLSPGKHASRARMCAFPGQHWHHQGWGLSGHPTAAWGGQGCVMDGGASPGTAGDWTWHLLPLLPPQGWRWVAIIHSHRGCGGSSLASPVIAPQLLSLFQMLDVTVSQLLSLQPSLAARVTPKHRDVKESWAQLQQVLR